MAYGDFKDLSRRPASDKVLCDKASNIAENSTYYVMNVNEDCFQWFEKRFGKNLSVGAVTRA